MLQTKIATCCYCGTRAALVLKGRDRHELACSSCGAPLHDMKMLRTGAVDVQAHRAPQPGRKGKTRHIGATAPVPRDQRHAPAARRKKKPRKSLARSFLEEAFDLIEDIFD